MTQFARQQMRIARLLNMRGLLARYQFVRPARNQYGEPLNIQQTTAADGHLLTEYYTRSGLRMGGAAAEAVAKNEAPTLLVPNVTKDIRAGDVTEAGGRRYTVSRVENFRDLYLLIFLREGGTPDVA